MSVIQNVTSKSRVKEIWSSVTGMPYRYTYQLNDGQPGFFEFLQALLWISSSNQVEFCLSTVHTAQFITVSSKVYIR